MAWIRRAGLLLLVNILVVGTISTIAYFLGIGHAGRDGSLGALAAFSLLWGMGGAFISLLMSRFVAKAAMGVKLVEPGTHDPALRHLVSTVERLARSAGLPVCPEVGVYNSRDINAFATGPSRSRALVAVSTGLLGSMDTREVEGVLGHEISHIANGDMVTMTLLQGVANAFALFLSRLLAFAIAQSMRSRDDDEGHNPSAMLIWPIQMVLEIVFMMLGSLVVAWFSRYREFRADEGGAKLAGKMQMVRALQRLAQQHDGPVPDGQATVQTLQINGHPRGLMALFASHPPLEERIRRLQAHSDLSAFTPG